MQFIALIKGDSRPASHQLFRSLKITGDSPVVLNGSRNNAIAVAVNDRLDCSFQGLTDRSAVARQTYIGKDRNRVLRRKCLERNDGNQHHCHQHEGEQLLTYCFHCF